MPTPKESDLQHEPLRQSQEDDEYAPTSEQIYESLVRILKQRVTEELKDSLLTFFISLKEQLPLTLKSDFTIWMGAKRKDLRTVILTFYVAAYQETSWTELQKDEFDAISDVFSSDVVSVAPPGLQVELEFCWLSENLHDEKLIEEMRCVIEGDGFVPIDRYEPLP